MQVFALLCTYGAAITLPLILSWVYGGPPRALHQELASGLGILAFAIVLAEFVLSGRFRRISNVVGMDVTMRFHQVMARSALVFALLHPLLYQGTPAGGTRPWDPTRQLTLTTDFWPLASGMAAWVLLGALVLLAIARTQLDRSYETWRLMHGLGALLIAGLLLHHTVTAGRYGAQPPMIWLWSAMTALAAGSLLYVYAVRPLTEGRRPWRVTAITRLAERQWQITLVPDGHAGLDFAAGQFVWLTIGRSAFSLHENPFSICSAPASGPQVSFMIKQIGDFTDSVPQIRPGTRAYLDGPYGSLRIDGRPEPGVALIAGGVGLAPLLSILRQMRATDDPRQVHLVYGNRSESQIAYRDELGPDTTLTLYEPPPGWQGHSGYVAPDLIDAVFTPQQIATWVFVLCGPGPMMDSIEDHLIKRGTPASRILSERFDYD